MIGWPSTPVGDGMATSRKRGDKYEFKVTRKRVLPAPGYVYFTFDSEEDGRDYCERLERLLDRGIVPDELQAGTGKLVYISDAIKQYVRGCSISDADAGLLQIQRERIGGVKISEISYSWAEHWIAGMKRRRKLAPGTIRHHVGALARCLDWLYRKEKIESNPLRMLPKGYANYTAADVAEAGVAKADQERDRRLEAKEESLVRLVLAGKYKPEDKQRYLDLPHSDALQLLFEMGLESAMRLREMYTLARYQVDIDRRTIFLEKTKNGDRRQVPITSVLHKALLINFQRYQFSDQDLIFPWWDGSPVTLKSVTSRLSRQWVRIFRHAGAEGIAFHDLRHEATSRLYERTSLSDLEIAKITGHKDLKMLKRYANLRGSSLASRLW